ncbi:MAG: LD-carboxypeptidase [Bacteroidota bacterium]
MNRRSFTRRALVAASAISTLSFSTKPKKLIRPNRLRKGDQVGLITPASYIDDEGLEKAVTNLEALGLKVVQGRNIRAQYGSMAGTDAQRLADLHQMFEDSDIKGIWCARGGYGAARLLKQIDFRLLQQNPKVFVGYSDITALHCAIQQKSGFITFHGPVGSSNYTPFTLAQLQATLFQPQPNHTITIAPEQLEEAESDITYAPYTVTSGVATGTLTGGNLSLLSALAGTVYLPDLQGKLLFMEDIGEKPYRLDRMLTTLRQAWPLSQAAGIVLGVFADCEASSGSLSLSLRETLSDRLGDLGIPVLYGCSFGHIDHMATLPMGVQAQLDTEAQTLTLLEPAVR